MYNLLPHRFAAADSTKWVRAALISLLIICCCGLTASARPDGSATQNDDNLFIWLIKAQGYLFFPLQMIISMLLVAFITTNALAIQRRNFVPLEFSEQFETNVKEKKFTEAMELCKEESSVLGRLVAAGLQRLSDGYQESIESMQEVGEEENLRYEHRLSYLALIGNVATLVGLLGTVWGMVASFMVIAKSGATPRPDELAKGVSQALVTTVVGLIQAIPAIVCFTIFKNRLAMFVLEVGVVGERMMQPFKGVVVRKTGDATK